MKNIHGLWWIIFLITWAQVSNPVHARIGLPNIISYSKSAYDGGSQNWSATQDALGIMYFANNYGVLLFDGVRWNRVVIPNYSVVRSVQYIEGVGVLAGAFNEFGVIIRDSLGNFQYQSWRQRLPSEIAEIGDIWKIHRNQESIFLQSHRYLILLDLQGNYLRHIEAQSEFVFSFSAGDSLIIQDLGQGLYQYQNDSLQPILQNHTLITVPIWGILPAGINNWLLFTQNKGAWQWVKGSISPWNAPVNELLIDHGFYSLMTTGDKLYLGTIQNGLIISSRSGDNYTELNKSAGLQNNTILAQYLDRDGNLWLGLDNGIDLLEINAPVRYIGKNGDLGAGYTSAIHQGKLYLGTNQGVYSQTAHGGNRFIELEELRGQAWHLDTVLGKLLCAHHNGIYEIEGEQSKQIYSGEGCWTIAEIPWDSDYLIVGRYSGLMLLKREGKRIIPSGVIEGFEESSRVISFDDRGDLWVSHGYKGVFRIKFNRTALTIDQVEYYGPESGLPSATNNEIFIAGQEVFAATVSGIYKYDHIQNRFIQSDKWNRYLGNYERVSKIIPGEDRSWYIFQEGILGKLQVLNDSIFLYNRNLTPYLNNKYIPAFEHLTATAGNKLIVGTEDGFAFVRERIPGDVRHLDAFFTGVSIVSSHQHRDISLRMPLDPMSKEYKLDQKIPWAYNNLEVQYAVTKYGTDVPIAVSYTLNNDQWDGPPTGGELMLTNLREGDYVLILQVTDIRTEEQVSRSIQFTILPPWYRHTLFYSGLILLILAASMITYYLVNRRIQLVRRKELILQRRKMIRREVKLKQQSDQAEQELVKIRNEKLQAEIVHKSKELANSTMNIIHKNQILTDLKTELSELSNRGDFPRSEARRFIRKIDKELEDDQGWKIFETHFDRVHENFFLRIREKHPELTPKDLRLCAFLRMNLSSKEIAPLQNISIRSVEISRYRLRKKLGLPHEVGLSDYILGI